eukprot:scaffold57308_cov55-Attheya_sp.AAC.5
MVALDRIPVGVIRPTDIVVLLIVGASYEAVLRTVSHLSKRRSREEVGLGTQLQTVRYEAALKRRLGASAFVETSKLERNILRKEKKLVQLADDRAKRSARVSYGFRNAAWVLYALVFLTYYGTPVLTLDGIQIETGDADASPTERAEGYMRGMLFPLTYVGAAMRFSGFGTEAAHRLSSISPLVVVWAAQATVQKVSECMEVLSLR